MFARETDFICTSNREISTGTVETKLKNPGPMGFALFPNQTYSDSFTWSGDAQPNLKWVYVMGCVAYVDQFDASHWTRFVVLIGDGRNPVDNNSPRQLYTLFNDTDETGEYHR